MFVKTVIFKDDRTPLWKVAFFISSGIIFYITNPFSRIRKQKKELIVAYKIWMKYLDIETIHRIGLL